MAQRKFKLAEDKGPHERAMDQIEANWNAWHGPNGEPWTPYSGSTTPWSEGISKSLDKGRHLVLSEPRIPWWRRALRWRIFR
jgi:hypothetical protein